MPPEAGKDELLTQSIQKDGQKHPHCCQFRGSEGV